jgi:hypothetical protein
MPGLIQDKVIASYRVRHGCRVINVRTDVVVVLPRGRPDHLVAMDKDQFECDRAAGQFFT